MLRKIYLSPFGIVISLILNMVAYPLRGFMVYGYWDRPSKQFRKYTRISSTAILENRAKISISDHVWIGHFNVLDGSNQIIIGRGCQLAANVSIFTHGSQTAIRLYGDDFIKIASNERAGYTRGAVIIGDYTFIGAGSIVMPGVSLGKGCLVGAGSLVNMSAPDFSLLRGSPAQIVGDVRDLDKGFIDRDDITNSYFDQAAIKELLATK
jgi:acetyltransferase-like isoleucine patch superfamily enzyme